MGTTNANLLETESDTKSIYILKEPTNWFYFTNEKNTKWIIWELQATALDLYILQNCNLEAQKQYLEWVSKLVLA